MTEQNSLSAREITLMAAAVVVVIGTFLLTPALPQDPGYHQFADTRSFLGIRNFGNVVSNLPFLIVGFVGLRYLRLHSATVCPPGLHVSYVIFFAGIFLTAFGSAYYHVAPANGTLVWDRLPMTIGFAGLFCVIVGEFISVRAARRILVPFLFIGVASVTYWAATEARGAGDLRPYALVQFLPLFLILFILLSYRSSSRSTKYYWLMIVFYAAAKLFELFDATIYAGQVISGHTLKHLFASLTPATMLYALSVRRHSG